MQIIFLTIFFLNNIFQNDIQFIYFKQFMSKSRKTNKEKKLPPSKSKLTQPSFNDPDIDFDLDLAQFSYKPKTLSKDKKQTPEKTAA